MSSPGRRSARVGVILTAFGILAKIDRVLGHQRDVNDPIERRECRRWFWAIPQPKDLPWSECGQSTTAP